ncbi:MAG: M23 family metallopeptidase [Evtepia sp.]
MDEISTRKTTHSSMATRSARFLDTVSAPFGRLARHIPRALHQRDVARAERPLRSAVPFLIVSVCIGLFAVISAFYTPCYSLRVNDEPFAYVQNETVLDLVTKQVEGQVSAILGTDYTLELQTSISPVLAKNELVSSSSQLADDLFSAIPSIAMAYVLTVDDVPVGAAPDRATLDSALNTRLAQFSDPTVTARSFQNDIRITKKYVPAVDANQSPTQLIAHLTATAPQTISHIIAPGETLDSIALAYHMNYDQLLALNPNLNTTPWQIGQSLNVTKDVPCLSVATVEHISYTQVLEAPVYEQTSDSLYIGERQILQPGEAGEAVLQADVTLLNGEEQSRTILSNIVAREPTATIIAVGTKELPPAFVCPTAGRITSPFGYRYIFGSTSFHTGVDIANPYGTPISASQSGTVTFSGPQGSYGNLVILDHGNGFQTYYAHCSSILVAPGDPVVSGQVIAQTGTTGRSTGNHLHFEIRFNRVPIDPLQYIS